MKISCHSYAIVALVVLALTPATYAQTREECEQACVKLLVTAERAGADKLARLEEIAGQKNKLAGWAKRHPDSLLIQYLAGMAYVLAEEPGAAIDHLESAYSQMPGDAAIGQYLVFAYKGSQRPFDALRVLSEVAEKNPSPLTNRYGVALQMMAVQKYDQALAILKELNVFEDQPDAQAASYLCSLGECQLYLGSHDEAIGTLKRAVELIDDAVVPWTLLAEAYLKSAETDKAKEALRTALKLKKDHRDANFWTAAILSNGKSDRAALYFEKALLAGEARLSSNAENGIDHFRMWQIYEAIGKSDEAERARQDARRLGFTFEAPYKK